MTKLEVFIDWYSKIQKNKVANSFSPHKPLTILLALSNILRGKRWIEFNLDREGLEDLISSYSNTKPKILQPLWRLKNDSKINLVWTVLPNDLKENSSGDISPTDAREENFKAGFSNEYYQWFTDNKAATQQLIEYIIDDNFPETLHDDLLNQLGVSEISPIMVTETQTVHLVTKVVRDPNFPKKIMQAYDYRCSFCELKIYQGHKPFAMQAAHIKWKAQGGICDETNGLSLCPTHHYTFDKGIWTLTLDYKIQLNDEVIIDERTDRFFKDFEGKFILNSLLNKNLAPKEEFINWHRNNIFKSKAKE